MLFDSPLASVAACGRKIWNKISKKTRSMFDFLALFRVDMAVCYADTQAPSECVKPMFHVFLVLCILYRVLIPVRVSSNSRQWLRSIASCLRHGRRLSRTCRKSSWSSQRRLLLTEHRHTLLPVAQESKTLPSDGTCSYLHETIVIFRIQTRSRLGLHRFQSAKCRLSAFRHTLHPPSPQPCLSSKSDSTCMRSGGV